MWAFLQSAVVALLLASIVSVWLYRLGFRIQKVVYGLGVGV